LNILYGIPNCDTVKKARRWLDTHHIAYQFHDFKKLGIDRTTLKSWIENKGVDAVLNRRSTTWRALSTTEKNAFSDGTAIDLLGKYPTLIRRPVVKTESGILVGFDQKQYSRTFCR
jgi:Spx/MgsR family transcriptional regulator